jgi:hypothetical protein
MEIISHLYSNREGKKKVKKITPKKYQTKEFGFLWLPIMNYCIVIIVCDISKSKLILVVTKEI